MHDQQTEGPDDNLPCPWCGAKQDLSTLEIDVDARVGCDDCGRNYVITAMHGVAKCPQCGTAREVTTMEMAENAVTHCVVCHRVFRPDDAHMTTLVTAERSP